MLKRWRINLKLKKKKEEVNKKRNSLGFKLLLPLIFIAGNIIDFHSKSGTKYSRVKVVKNKNFKEVNINSNVIKDLTKRAIYRKEVSENNVINFSNITKNKIFSTDKTVPVVKSKLKKGMGKINDGERSGASLVSTKKNNKIKDFSVSEVVFNKDVKLNNNEDFKKILSEEKNNIKSEDLNKDVNIVEVETKKLKKMNLEAMEVLFEKSNDKINTIINKILKCNVYNELYGLEFDLKYIELPLSNIEKLDLSKFIIEDRDKKKELDKELKKLLDSTKYGLTLIETRRKQLLKKEKKLSGSDELEKEAVKEEKKVEKIKKIEEFLFEKEYIMKSVIKGHEMIKTYRSLIVKTGNKRGLFMKFFEYFSKRALGNILIPRMLFPNVLVADLISMTLITNDLLSLKGLFHRDQIDYVVLNTSSFIYTTETTFKLCERSLSEIESIKNSLREHGFSNSECVKLCKELDEIELFLKLKKEELEKNLELGKDYIKILKKEA